MLDHNGETELHAFDRKSGVRSVIELSAIEKEGEYFIRLDTCEKYLRSDGTYLYTTGDGGSGGYYRTDPVNKTYERIGHYQDVAMSEWAFISDTVFFAMSDSQGYGLYAAQTDNMNIYSPLPDPLLRREGLGRFDVIYAESEHLILFEKAPGKEWYDLLCYTPQTSEVILLAENVNTDYAPCIDDTYIICRFVGKEDGYKFHHTEVVLINNKGEQIAKLMDLDGLWRATAAGGKIVLDHMYADHIDTEHTVYVIDPRDMNNIQAVLLGESEANVIIGGDEKYAYFWDRRQLIDHDAQLLALDMKTLEVINLFE